MDTTLQQNTYDQFADDYAQSYVRESADDFNFNLDLTIPRLIEVVGNVDGCTVLDAGCGEGIVSRSLKGSAARIVGLDVAPRLIAYARERDVSRTITYETHDLSMPLPQYADTFELIVSNMVLNDVPDYESFIRVMSSVLKPGGRFVLSMNNPYSALVREKVENYFDSSVVTQYALGPVYYFHRTMEQYCKAFQEAGLLLQCLYDVEMTPDMVAKLPEKNRDFPWFSLYDRYPFILILELVKPKT